MVRSRQLPRWPVAVLLCVVLALAAWIRIAAAAYVFIFGLPAYVLAFLIHGVLHATRIARGAVFAPRDGVHILSSHFAFLLGVLLQWDCGDGSAWLVAARIFTSHLGGPGLIPSWWPDSWPMNFAVGVPAFVSWPLLIRHGSRTPSAA